MKSTVAIFDSHWNALNAVAMLKNRSYPIDQVSLMGQARNVENYLNIKSVEPIKSGTTSVSTVIASTLGLIPGVSIFAIPGYGFVFGAGPVKKKLASFITGPDKGNGIESLLTKIGIENDKINEYKEYLETGKYLVIAHGNEAEVEKAQFILIKGLKHIELSVLN